MHRDRTKLTQATPSARAGRLIWLCTLPLVLLFGTGAWGSDKLPVKTPSRIILPGDVSFHKPPSPWLRLREIITSAANRVTLVGAQPNGEAEAGGLLQTPTTRRDFLKGMRTALELAPYLNLPPGTQPLVTDLLTLEPTSAALPRPMQVVVPFDREQAAKMAFLKAQARPRLTAPPISPDGQVRVRIQEETDGLFQAQWMHFQEAAEAAAASWGDAALHAALSRITWAVLFDRFKLLRTLASRLEERGLFSHLETEPMWMDYRDQQTGLTLRITTDPKALPVGLDVEPIRFGGVFYTSRNLPQTTIAYESGRQPHIAPWDAMGLTPRMVISNHLADVDLSGYEEGVMLDDRREIDIDKDIAFDTGTEGVVETRWIRPSIAVLRDL